MEPVFAVTHDPAVQPPPPPYGLGYQTAAPPYGLSYQTAPPPPPPQVQQGGGGGGRVTMRLVLRLIIFLAANVAFAFAIYRQRHNPRDLALLIVGHVVFSVLFFCVPKLKQLRRDRKRRAAEMGLADAASRPETALRQLSPEPEAEKV